MLVGLFECFEAILFTQELIGLIYSNAMNAERRKKDNGAEQQCLISGLALR